MKPDVKSLTQDELAAQFKTWGQPAYRVTQLLSWLYPRRATSWEAMTNLPKPLRAQLAETYTLDTLALARQQGRPGGTRKFLWRLPDQALVESVLIPASPALDGDPSDRLTLCVSTQVGCAYGCAFCASGLDGWKRNLGPHEIVEQVLAAERLLAAEAAAQPKAPQTTEPQDPAAPTEPAQPKPAKPPGPSDERAISNLVIMGMGEPLANYDNLLKALCLLNAPWGGGIGARKITISTCGLAPEIRRLADEPHQFRLAISLHGATDAVRNRVMPVNRKYPLSVLTSACQDYLSRKGRMISLEYILLAGLNDGPDQARPLADLALRFNAKVNLIPCNPVEGLPWAAPSPERQEAFFEDLRHQGVNVTLRREKGADIDAACGQLRLKTLAEPPLPVS